MLNGIKIFEFEVLFYPGDEPKEDTAMAILSVWGWNAMHRTRVCIRCHFRYLDLSIPVAKIEGIAVLPKNSGTINTSVIDFIKHPCRQSAVSENLAIMSSPDI